MKFCTRQRLLDQRFSENRQHGRFIEVDRTQNAACSLDFLDVDCQGNRAPVFSVKSKADKHLGLNWPRTYRKAGLIDERAKL